MLSMFAVLVYLVALAVPIWLLYHFGSGTWPWHVLAIATALVLGFIPIPAALKGAGAELIFGFVFTFLMVWGIGGLIVYRPHLHRHA